jgi:hypothetical protein
MALLRKKTLKSANARLKRIDKTFMHIGHTLIVVYAIFAFLAWLSLRPSLQITQIQIEGTHAVSTQTVASVAEKYLHIPVLHYIHSDNSLLYPAQKVVSEIKALSPRIAYAAAVIDAHRVLHVSVTEYTPTFLYCTGMAMSINDASSSSSSLLPNDCYFADEKGYVYAAAPEYLGYPFVALVASSSDDGLPAQNPVGTYAVPKEEYKNIHAFIDALARAGFSAHTVVLLGEHDVRVAGDMPWTILWTTTRSSELSVENLKLVRTSIGLDKKSEAAVHTIDLRFGDKIFYQ